MSATKGVGGRPKADSCRKGGGGQPNVDVHIEQKMTFFFIITVICKHFLSNINLIFEYSVLHKIRLNCKMYPFPPNTFCIYH